MILRTFTVIFNSTQQANLCKWSFEHSIMYAYMDNHSSRSNEWMYCIINFVFFTNAWSSALGYCADNYMFQPGPNNFTFSLSFNYLSPWRTILFSGHTMPAIQWLSYLCIDLFLMNNDIYYKFRYQCTFQCVIEHDFYYAHFGLNTVWCCVHELWFRGLTDPTFWSGFWCSVGMSLYQRYNFSNYYIFWSVCGTYVKK